MDKPPSRLYKYMASNRKAIFDDWLIRFTQPKALNDPFEMRPHIAGYSTPAELRRIAERHWEEHIRDDYERLVREDPGHGKPMSFEVFRARCEPGRKAEVDAALLRVPEYKAEMARQIDAMINESIGVLSLCEHPDSLLMWPHYGDSHRGFVIAFDTDAPYFRQTEPPLHVNADADERAKFTEEYGYLRKIRYKAERPDVLVTDMQFDTIMTKGKEWEYEGEWRMLMPLDYATERKGICRGFPVCLFAVPPSAVTHILLGCNADDELIAHALTLKQRDETRHIEIQRATTDEKHFKLRFEAIG